MRDSTDPVPALLCLPVERVLHRLGGREGQLLRRSDLDGLAGRRIAAFTRRAVLYLEFAEAVQRDFLALRCGVRDGGEDAIDIFARIGLGNAVCGGKGVGRSEEHTSELQSLMRLSYA